MPPRADRDRRKPGRPAEPDRHRGVLAPPDRRAGAAGRPAPGVPLLRPNAGRARRRGDDPRRAVAAALDPLAALARDAARTSGRALRAVARRTPGAPEGDGRDRPRPWVPALPARLPAGGLDLPSRLDDLE